MAVKLEQAELHAEYVSHTDTLGGVVEFEAAADGEPTESIAINYKTWQEMGFPHFVTIKVTTTK